MMFKNAMLYALFGICIYSSALNNVVDCLCNITSGTSNAVRIGENASCTQVLESASGFQAQYLWNTGQISCLNFSVLSNKLLGNIINVLTGVVSCGPFNTLPFTRIDIFPDISPNCTQPGGVTKLSGVGIGSIGPNTLLCNETITYSPGLTNNPQLINITFTRVCTIVAAMC